MSALKGKLADQRRAVFKEMWRDFTTSSPLCFLPLFREMNATNVTTSAMGVYRGGGGGGGPVCGVNSIAQREDTYMSLKKGQYAGQYAGEQRGHTLHQQAVQPYGINQSYSYPHSHPYKQQQQQQQQCSSSLPYSNPPTLSGQHQGHGEGPSQTQIQAQGQGHGGQGQGGGQSRDSMMSVWHGDAGPVTVGQSNAPLYPPLPASSFDGARGTSAVLDQS